MPGLETWSIDPTHSLVEFAVKHMGIAMVRGHFNKLQGALRLDDAAPERAEVHVEIEAGSVDTRDAKRDGHLRSADFFDVARFPTITLASRRIERAGERRYRVTSDLTIRGVTREVVLDAAEQGRGTDPWGNERLGFGATATIDRREFGLTWNQELGPGGSLLASDVRLLLEGEAIRTKP